MPTCPFCGGQVVQYQIGLDKPRSLCCDLSMELIDNAEVLEGIPEHLRRRALEGDWQEMEAYRQEMEERSLRFRKTRELWRKRPEYEALRKDNWNACQG